MSQMLIAAFVRREQADKAISELEKMGYNPKDLSIISKEDSTTSTTDAAGDAAAEGALSGAATGGAIGGVAGLLAGAGVIPAVAGLLIGGPIAVAVGATGVVATTISGVVTGAVAGGLIGVLTGLGLSDDTAQYYEQTVEEGGIILAVTVKEGGTAEAQAVFSEYQASQINTVDIT